MDSCSVILLAKASVLETLLEEYAVVVTSSVYKEVMKGKLKLFKDALLVERLKKEGKLTIISVNTTLMKKLRRDFNMGEGEASTLAATLKEKEGIIVTDNRQGRKAAHINNLLLVGSIELVVSLYRKKRITREKVLHALNILKDEGWFDDHLIETAKGDVP